MISLYLTPVVCVIRHMIGEFEARLTKTSISLTRAAKPIPLVVCNRAAHVNEHFSKCNTIWKNGFEKARHLPLDASFP